MFYIEDKNFLKKHHEKFIEDVVMGENFPFYILKNAAEKDGCDLLTHIIKHRAENIDVGNPEFNSNFYPDALNIVYSFFSKNKIKFKKILRLAFNLTYNNGFDKCGLHEDHSYPHKQLIIYLNDVLDKNSKTVILDKNKKIFKEIIPEKYKGVCFDSHLHYHYFPKKGKRIVLVCTFE